MKRRPSLKLRLYLALTVAGSLVALALGLPQAIALAAPFAAYVAVGLALAAQPGLILRTELARDRILEEDEVILRVRVNPRTDVPWLELTLAGTRLQPMDGARRTMELAAGKEEVVEFHLRARRWGGYRIGALSSSARDRFGLIEYELPTVQLPAVRVFPRLQTLRALMSPLELQATMGSRVSPSLGEGIEFAEVRPFSPGDRLRRINWRATARRGIPYVSERHPERNADVILFMDTFTDVEGSADSTLSLGVRAAASLAAEYLARKDRVGLVGFGGMLRALEPRMGTAQIYRILDALIGSQLVFSYAHKDVSFVPRRLLPAKALIIGISPLVDERSIGALFDLRARGFDLAVINITPVPLTAPGPTPAEQLAYRLWLLQREAVRARFERLGVAVTEWQGERPLQPSIAQAAVMRRRSRPLRAA